MPESKDEGIFNWINLNDGGEKLAFVSFFKYIVGLQKYLHRIV